MPIRRYIASLVMILGHEIKERIYILPVLWNKQLKYKIFDSMENKDAKLKVYFM